MLVKKAVLGNINGDHPVQVVAKTLVLLIDFDRCSTFRVGFLDRSFHHFNRCIRISLVLILKVLQCSFVSEKEHSVVDGSSTPFSFAPTILRSLKNRTTSISLRIGVYGAGSAKKVPIL